MPKRTIMAFNLGFYVRRSAAAERQLLSLNDSDDGITFSELVEECWTQERLDDRELKSDGRHILIDKPVWVDGVLLLKARAGHFGETGPIVNVTSGATIHDDVDGDTAKLGELRIGYYEPDRTGELGYAVIEGSSGGHMRKEFESVLRAKVSDSGNFTLHIERAMNGEEWLATKAELEKVIVKQRVKSTDYATDSSSPVRAGQIRVEYGPVKGQRYFPGLFAKIRNKKLNPRDLIALERVEDEKVQLVLGDSEGRSRTMDVDNLRSPYLLEVISEPEEPALTDEQFARLAKDRINDLAGIGADD